MDKGASPESLDAFGLEGPFTERMTEDSEFDYSRETFAESPFTETDEALAEEFQESDEAFDEASSYEGPAFEAEAFPSGAVLQTAAGATGYDEEHWDPHATGLPLLATGPSTHALRLSDSFTVKELVTTNGRPASIARISPALVRVLQAIRDHLDKPVRISSGYRSWKRNKEVYAKRPDKLTRSRHCSGQAADIAVAGMSGVALAKAAIDAAGPDLGLGIGGDFIHVDVRGVATVWSYSKGVGAKEVAQVKEHLRLHQRSRAPIPPAPAPRPNSGARRLVVTKHPLLGAHRGSAPDLILRWNRIDASGPVDVVIHFHGHSKAREAMHLGNEKERISGLDFADPSNPAATGRTRPTIGVLPRGDFAGADPKRNPKAYDFPALTKPGAVQSLARDALSRVGGETGLNLSLGRLILTGHSGGGSPISKLLDRQGIDPDEVHIFDGMYSPGDGIVAWANQRIAREIAAPTATPPALRVLYQCGTKKEPGTQVHSENAARKLHAILADPAAARLKPRFRVERTSADHTQMPRLYGWRLLADAGADLPGASAFNCGSVASGETFGEAFEELSCPSCRSPQAESWVEEAFAENEGFDGEDSLSAAEEEFATGEEALNWLDEEQETDTEEFEQWPLTEGEAESAAGEAVEAEEMHEDAEAEPSESDEGEFALERDSGAPSSELEALEALLEAEAGRGTGLSDRLKGVAGLMLGANLRRGAVGGAVAALQGALVKLGHDLAIDGVFGPNTERAVRAFQSQSALSPDGIVGPLTKTALAAALGDKPAPSAPPAISSLNPARWEPILRKAFHSTPTLESGNSVQFLIDGRETFREMVKAIRAAKSADHYIYILAWVLIDDFELIPGDKTSTMRQLLYDAASRGVQIRAMLWQQIRISGCHAKNEAARKFIDGLRTGAAIMDNETLLTAVVGVKTGSHHQKVLIVKSADGLVSFCGGVDANSDRIGANAGCAAFGSGGGGPGQPLHDVHCRIVGPSAYDLLQTFDMRWRHHPDSDKIDAQRGPLIGRNEKRPAPLTASAPNSQVAPRTCSVAIARTFLPANLRLWPKLRECDIRALLLASIAAARRFIYIEDQYLVSIEAALALNAAAPRLDHITILTTASEIATDLLCPWKMRLNFVKALKSGLSAVDAAKVRVFQLGSPPFGVHTYIHAKTWMFDDELAVIGSANCNRRGWETDSEVNAFVFEDAAAVAKTPITASAPSFAQALRQKLWAEHLGLPESALSDGVASVRHWRSPPPTARIAPYREGAGSDPSRRPCPPDLVDPSLPCARPVLV